MPTAQQQREKLVRLLKELFQLDQPDLDFGFYRIMHAKSAQVSAFLDKDLLAIVEAAFGKESTAKRAELEQAYQGALQHAKEFGAPEPDKAPAVLKAKAALDAAADTASAEADVYDHLYRFFERYYDNGDFLSRRYLSAETGSKAAAFAVPYDGREVYLHWANADQYYIKTSEYFTNFTFDPTAANEVQAVKGTLFDGKDLPALKVHFRVVEATEGEHGNVKASVEQKRFFILTGGQPAYFENGDLVVGFEFRPDPEKTGQDRTWQDKRNGEAVERVLAALDDLAQGGQRADAVIDGQPVADLARQYARVLRTPAPTDKQPNRPMLARYVAQYTARNTMDYFIHKNLGGFLRRELDFYIKNEVMRLDDVSAQPGAADVGPQREAMERQIRLVSVLRAIAQKLIDFLAQLENFQKKLWLKKKFVVEAHWCITLDRIIAIEDANCRDSLLVEIAANDAQREEWVRLFAIDEIKTGLQKPGYSKPLTVGFVRANPTLLLDTRFFGCSFTDRLFAAIECIDARTDGLLLHSENFQALGLIHARYAREVDCVYIDPPYNTGDSEILYRNEYISSSWLSLMENRLRRSQSLLVSDPVLFIAIDDFEMTDLCEMVDCRFSQFRREMIIINHHPQGGKARTLANTHEYMLTCVPRNSARTLAGREQTGEVERRAFKRAGTAESNYRYGRPNSFYAVLVNPNTKKVIGLETPPPLGTQYPTGPTAEGSTRVYPLGSGGEERVWRRSYESCLTLVREGKLVCTDSMTIYQLIESHDRTTALFSNWIGPRYNAGTFGANLVRDIIGGSNPFSYPKSIHTVEDALFSIGAEDDAVFLDYFAGSGTTGHAVVRLNREDGGSRKYILVEMGDYFTGVTKPRMEKIIYSDEWKGGKPGSRGAGVSQMFKYIRLESYEDALNNLAFEEDAERDKALAASAGLRQEYMLHYMLDVETRGSQSLLNIDAFADPTAYKLKVKKPGSDEYVWKNVDLIETFNYLIGLRVEHMAAPQTFTAKFKREKDPELPKDTNTKLVLDGKLKQDAKGPWWFRRVEGWVPQGTNDGREKVLILWRKLTGDIEQDNLVLDEYFQAHRINTKDWEFDTIYVNGSNNLPNLKREDDKWKVRLIEEDFHRLMWDVEDV